MDTLIVGGGPAGAAAAIGLARGGRSPLILERQREGADPLCGGFLSWTTIAALERLGVHVDDLGGHRIDRMKMFAGNRSASARLPAPAVGISRRRLDASLLARAELEGAAVERGVAASHFDDGEIATTDGAALRFDTMVLATGKHELRGLARPAPEGERMVGLRWRLGASRRLHEILANTIEIHCFRGGYAGLVMQEETANLCLAVSRHRLAEESSAEALLLALSRECPALEARLSACSGLGERQAIANMPYGWRARSSLPHVYRVGDQAGVIPSLAGEGLAIALVSGGLAARAILQGRATDAFQPDLAHRLRRPFRVAGAVTDLACRPDGARMIVALANLSPAIPNLAARLARVRQA
ncbi:NAD(P)/FAD-dependent oxidoreductase [Sphingomonas sp. PR090111-T3T-6A]|uniref:NAD(P)/FAD-dependent oxidoreductase n=1 Tax=Sphingomonas sp. PR090111-T3T-6A TaxID=685778 RepID=UPI00037B6412|nr:FAD-dependent monooxygenase [Sphingomonas sp. PR090111-T3T-6A]